LLWHHYEHMERCGLHAHKTAWGRCSLATPSFYRRFLESIENDSFLVFLVLKLGSRILARKKLVMTKRVFLTGGTGTNGPYVAKALVAAGHNIVALVRNPNKPEAAELRSLGIELLVGDTNDLLRSDSPQMEKVGSCDWVVWLSQNWGDFSAELPMKKSVLQKLESTSSRPNTKGFIYSSGVAGYKEANSPDSTLVDEAASEEDSPLKLQERTILQYPNIIGVSIRLGFSYSDRPQHHSGLFSGLFKKFDKAAGIIQAKGSPRIAWSPIHLDDLGSAYAAVISADPVAVKGQAFNVCGDDLVDNGMVADAVAKVLGIDPATIDWTHPLWGIANKRVFMDNSKAKRVLGWKPKFNNAAEYVPTLMASAYPSGVAEFT